MVGIVTTLDGLPIEAGQIAGKLVEGHNNFQDFDCFIKNGGNILIAGILGAMVVMILFRIIYHILARAFFAQQDTKTPMYISIFAIGLNIGLAIFLSMTLGMKAYGLAWAQSIVAVVEVAILFVVLSTKMPGIFTRGFWRAVTRMTIAGAGMGMITYLTVLIFPLQSGDQSFFSTFPKFTLISLISFAAYLGLSKILKVREANPVIDKINKILFAKVGPTS